MSKILVVSYTPRTHSHTEKLLDCYLASLADDAEIDVLDLVQTPVQQHSSAVVDALLKRNFAGQPLNTEEQRVVADSDALMQRLLDCDTVVFAFPFYNFCVPAAIKAWLDAVVQKGLTFDITEQGEYVGLCGGKRALVLMSSGGDYREAPMSAMNMATPLMQNCLGFMGIETHAISAFGLDQYADRVADIVVAAQADIEAYVAESV